LQIKDPGSFDQREGIGVSWSLTQKLSLPLLSELARSSNVLVGIVAPSRYYIRKIMMENKKLRKEGFRIIWAKDPETLSLRLKRNGASRLLYLTTGAWELAAREGYDQVKVFDQNDLNRITLSGIQGLTEAIQRYNQLDTFYATMA
jgi:hypothetical protein